VTQGDAPARLLIVSHEEELRVLLRRSLRNVGYEVDVAVSEAEAAARVADAGSAQLVLVDLALPRRGGWALLSRLRALPHAAPAVVLLPRGDYRGLAEAVREGAAACMLRPFKTEDLVATCQAVLVQGGPPPGAPERRLDARRLLVAEIAVFAQDGTALGTGDLADLGLGGARVRLPRLIEAGTRIHFVLPVPVGTPLRLDAVVQWTGRARAGFAHGLQFVDLTLALRRQIEDLVNASAA
jgi:CheY-like chemotaxis protein